MCVFTCVHRRPGCEPNHVEIHLMKHTTTPHAPTYNYTYVHISANVQLIRNLGFPY